ncbi:hypothetical protein [Deinococcus marmoris]|uniref:Uncharacterized protein n=1 Tax=Deinococcus marmoris TaxID=249408 RepID=A0A1U7P4U9_9DEIO|nr:hypothetical protein [Deinococcus marmoris]OLV20194.1 hypothetical protein BOO71_0000610 [Deinococcus marmoris]
MATHQTAPVLRLPTALPVGSWVFHAGRDRRVLSVRYSPSRDDYQHVLS